MGSDQLLSSYDKRPPYLETPPEGYDYEGIPPCSHCKTTEFRYRDMSGQLLAYCRQCGRHIKNVPKLKNTDKTRRKDQRHLKRQKAAEIGGEFCQWCLYDGKDKRTGTWLEVHHIVEVIRGGTDDMNNIMLLCNHCHTMVHSLRKIAKREYTTHLPTTVPESDDPAVESDESMQEPVSQFARNLEALAQQEDQRRNTKLHARAELEET